jgi:hypothetical protein
MVTACGAVHQTSAEIDDHDIGLHRFEINRSAFDCSEGFGQEAGALMIFPQSFHMILQSIEPGCRQDSGLTHAAAEDLAKPMARWINCEEPTSTDPTGAPKPLERHIEMESTQSP